MLKPHNLHEDMIVWPACKKRIQRYRRVNCLRRGFPKKINTSTERGNTTMYVDIVAALFRVVEESL